MKLFLQFVLLILYITITQSSIYTDIKNNVLSLLQRSSDKYMKQYPKISKYTNNDEFEVKENSDISDIKVAKSKAKNFKKHRNFQNNLNERNDISYSKFEDQKIGKENYHIDPVLNFLRRRSGRTFQRNMDSDSGDSSSSKEMKNWKDEWREHWIQKKFEAINSTEPRGDVVNMVAARPWGVPCGDPNQHDMPWGSCMLPMECEAEYRIYRGDYFCGRTQFVCCSLQVTTYDMYQGFDVSFGDTSLSTDSEEKRNRGKGSKEKRHRKKRHERTKRKRDQLRRKRKIKNKIRKIIKEIKKILNRSYRNGTTVRKKKTAQLKKFINELKDQYRKDRQSVKDIHELELIKIDAELQKRLDQIRGVNQDFISNSTFRDIVVNGTISKQQARMLVQAYPELASFLDTRRSRNVDKPKDYLEYDIEYGLLYY